MASKMFIIASFSGFLCTSSLLGVIHLSLEISSKINSFDLLNVESHAMALASVISAEMVPHFFLCCIRLLVRNEHLLVCKTLGLFKMIFSSSHPEKMLCCTVWKPPAKPIDASFVVSIVVP